MTTPAVIAEWGQTHEGKLEKALTQAQRTAAAGATWAKWQVFAPERLAHPSAKRYWDPALGGTESQLATYQAQPDLSRDEWGALNDECKRLGIGMLLTPFDLEGVELVGELGLRACKIASADIDCWPLVDAIHDLGVRVYASVGAAARYEIEALLDRLRPRPVVLLACTLSYPTQAEHMDLGAITRLAELEQAHPNLVGVGLSDHSLLRTESALAAGALGAVAIERHVTMGGPTPDDAMGLPVDDLAAYVDAAQLGARLRGANGKHAAEHAALSQARRGIYAARDVDEGHRLTRDDIIALRPIGKAIPVSSWDHVIGALSTAPLGTGDPITWEGIGRAWSVAT